MKQAPLLQGRAVAEGVAGALAHDVVAEVGAYERERLLRRAAPYHVKGRSSKRGETLRVHFFADYGEPGGRIVIAHCGEHLETFATSSL